MFSGNEDKQFFCYKTIVYDLRAESRYIGITEKEKKTRSKRFLLIIFNALHH